MSDPQAPGVIIEKILEGRNLSLEGLCALIPCSPTVMSAIVYDQHEITSMMAKKLAKVLGNTEQYWLDLDQNYRDHQRFLDSNGLGHRYDELG